MDLSLSLSSDPQFTPHASYPTSNPFVSRPVSAPNNPFFGGPPGFAISYNNHVFQPQPQPQPLPPQVQSLAQNPYVQPLESSRDCSYPEMISVAIAALNDPEGSSKMAISRYIESNNPTLPAAHRILLSHHLKILKTIGLLVMVKRSYKLAAPFPLESVDVAASAASLRTPKSEILPTDDTVSEQGQFHMVTASSLASASVPQKRGRGRTPKPKPGAQQPIAHANGLTVTNPAMTNPTEEVQVTVSAKRGPGRPRKDGSAPISRAGVSGVMKQRGIPPGRIAAFVNHDVANSARCSGRSSMAETSDTVVAPAGLEVVAVAPRIKRGRGRPPKISGVVNRIITKPKRGRGRPGRPRKNTTWAITGATGPQDTAYEELKKKFDLFQEKAMEIVNVLRAEIATNNPAVLVAIMNLEELTGYGMVEPEVMEEVQPEDVAPQTEAEPHTEDAPHTKAETLGMGQGQEREAGE